MGLIKQVETPSGAIAEYHNIPKGFLENVRKDTFLNKAKREAGANALAEEWLVLPDSVQDAIVALIYEYYKTTPDGEGAIDDL